MLSDNFYLANDRVLQCLGQYTIEFQLSLKDREHMLINGLNFI